MTLFSLRTEVQGLPKSESEVIWLIWSRVDRWAQVLKLVFVPAAPGATVRQDIWVIAMKGHKIFPGEYQSYLGILIKTFWVNTDCAHMLAPHSAPHEICERQEHLVHATFSWGLLRAMCSWQGQCLQNTLHVQIWQAIALFVGWRFGQVTME